MSSGVSQSSSARGVSGVNVATSHARKSFCSECSPRAIAPSIAGSTRARIASRNKSLPDCGDNGALTMFPTPRSL
jgi:hypothetical protein